MRNIPQALSPADDAVQRVRQADLSNRTGAVSVFYTKRDGSTGSATGPVQYFSGKPGFDTGSVTIDSSETKGRPTTINLHRIIKIQ